jgi:hypothetical protein
MEESALPETLRWRHWSGHGLEHLVLNKNGNHIEVHSAVISDPVGANFAALYSLRLDLQWRVMELQVSVVGTPGSVYLRRTEGGVWLDANATPVPDLNGICDVDLAITPFTNSLPIRRLNLAVGESAEIVTAYVAFPDLTISSDSQRYTRVASDRYRYESLDSDFVRDITVDRNGFVTIYPGLFWRIE